MKKLLTTLSVVLAFGSASVYGSSSDKSLIWRLNGDPLLDAVNPDQGFGYQKLSLRYPSGMESAQGTLSNKWYRVATFDEDPTLRGKSGQTSIPKSTGSWYASSLQTVAQKRAVALFGTVTHAAVQEYNDWQELKRLNPRGDLYERITGFQRRDTDQTVIYQDRGVDANAYYMGKNGKTPSSLNFFHFEGEDGRICYTGDSGDTALHEAGHKRLNDMHPGYFEETTDELGGFHEGYGDTYSLVYSVRDAEQRKLAFKQSGYNLHERHNVLSDLGEQFGAALGQKDGLRNLDTNKILGKTEVEVHEIGHIWAGGWYDILVDGHRYLLASRYRDGMGEADWLALSDQALLDAGNYVARLSLVSTLLVDEPVPSLGHFASTALRIVQERRLALTGIADVDAAPWDVGIKGHFGFARQIPVNTPGSGNFSIKKGKGMCGSTHFHLGDEEESS